MNVKVLTEIESIREQVPRCIELARRAGAELPCNFFYPAIHWWNHFNSRDGSAFWKKRGKNFFGNQSTLEQLFLFMVEEDGVLRAAAPFASYRVRPAGGQRLRILCYAGDQVLIPYQDITVDPSRSRPVLAAFIECLVKFYQEEGFDLLILDHQLDTSQNVPVIRDFFANFQHEQVMVREAVTSMRGGVRPWTIRQLSRRFRKLSEAAANEGVAIGGIEDFSTRLAECTSLKLLFPATRKVLAEELRQILARCRTYEALAGSLAAVDNLLHDRPICYPYISLPRDHEAFLANLSRSTRYYYRRYMKSFKKAGGTFETVSGRDISEVDVKDYLHLHQVRWGRESMFVCGDDSYAFHVDMVKAMAGDGLFSLFFAHFAGKRVAVLSSFDIHPRRECYFTGMDPEYLKTRAGRLLWLYSIYDAIDNGYEIYDLGPGDFGYKMSFATGEARSHNFLVTRNDCPLDLDSIFAGYECMVLV